MLQHDNASSHTAQQTVEFLCENNIIGIKYPPYSPDLAMCDFWLLFNLNKHLRDRRFTTEDEIDEAIHQFFESISKDDWLQTIKLWMLQLKKCIDIGGDYFEHK
ncbi:unnamed protein product [Psylliodes chrysocephalus]|uniref:Transposase n=1 Tax=Psylliodes chrysocephalus TaxID=3402493 RepID=A0A9P0D567_9CUCU|nr:unnamed protein product [Psylliodes chrysocephala]